MAKVLPLALATLLYVWQMGILLWTRDWASAIVFFGYAMANIGLIWSLS